MAKETPTPPDDNKSVPAQDKKAPETLIPETGAEDKSKIPPSDMPADKKLKKEQESTLKALDEKAAIYDKKKPAPEKAAQPPKEKQRHELGPPTGSKEDPRPPPPRESPRTGDKEQITYIKLS